MQKNPKWLQDLTFTVRPFIQRYVEAGILLHKGGRMKGGAALELGCGPGFGAPVILDRFGANRVVGVDIDAAMITRARADYGAKLGDRAEFHTVDVVELPFEDGSFEAVFNFAMLHHVVGWRTALTEVARVLEPGGRFYFEEFLQDLIFSRPVQAILHHPDEAQFTSQQFIDGMRAVGLELESKPTIVGELAMAGMARKVLAPDALQ